MKIGFFDSGLGGLTVLREVVKVLPDYDYIYYADTKHVPYGDRPETEILELTKKALIHLFERDCSLVIVACNTVSAETLRTLQDTFIKDQYPDRKVLGVIVPTIETLVEMKPKRAVLLGTERTVASRKYEKELRKLSADIALDSKSMTELVPLIEDHKTEIAASIGIGILEDMAVGKGEVVILGCTHYSLLKDALRDALPDVIFLSQDEIIPNKLSAYLTSHPEVVAELTRDRERTIHLTEHREAYNRLAAEFLGGSYVAGEDE
jgi:glutamate racemase